MRRCLEDDDEVVEPLALVRDGESNGGGFEECVPLTVGGGEAGGDSKLEVKIRSGESQTAESTRTSVILCNAGVTSAGFHSSSSTSFAD